MNTYYLKLAWRNLAKNKTFSFINVFGLCLGVSCSLFILLWVSDELHMDDFHQNGERLARVMVHNTEKDGSISSSGSYTEGHLPDALKAQIPEVVYATTVVWPEDMVFTVRKEARLESGRYVGEDFLRMFTFPLVEGNPATALASPDNIVLTEKLAASYFHGEDPIGKTIRIDNHRDYIVSGVAKDPPENSSIRFDFLLPVQHCFDDNAWMVAGWDHFGPDTYVLLRKGASLTAVNEKIRHFIAQQDPTVQNHLLSLQPVRDMYLYAQFKDGVATGGRIGYVHIFAAVAAFILLIACINFINLSTARASKRAKEVGIRKSVGAIRGMLIRQFLLEALCTAALAVLLSVGLVWLGLPFFNQLTDKQIHLHLDGPSLGILVGMTLLTGLLSGSYPALFLSSLNPVTVLKGKLRVGTGSAFLRKGLVILQFALSITLIVCTVVVNKQLHYIEGANLGLDRTNVVYVPVPRDLGTHFAAFRQTVEESGTIEGMTLISSPPTNIGWYSDNITWEGKPAGDKSAMAELDAGYDFLQVMHIKLAEGRDFSRSYATDTVNFLVNETAVQLMHLAHPIGSAFSHLGTKGKIIGVMKDFHLASLHDNIAPLFITLHPDMQDGVAAIRIRGDHTAQAMKTIKAAFLQYSPLFPFQSVFADALFLQQYHSEMMVGQLADAFAILAIVISCLGLFGLAMFVASQRTKEIGIRKVLGASVSRIYVLLSVDFLKPVALASFLAFPVGWYLMRQWLQGYAYKTDLNWWVFVLSGGMALVVTMITVGFQATRAALRKPVNSLRAE